MNRAVKEMGDAGDGRLTSNVMLRLVVLERITRVVGVSGTAEANVPKSSSAEGVGVCRVTWGP